MSIGTWLLSGFSAATGAAVAGELLSAVKPLPVSGPLSLTAQGAAALLGTGVATYTAALVSDTAVPAWHEGRHEMPFIFAGSASASAGGAAAIFTPTAEAGPARRLAIGGAIVEVAASELMKRRLGPIARPYTEGTVKLLDRLSTALTVGGAALLGTLGRRRPAAIAGGALLLAGSLCKRFAIFRAGFESTRQTTGAGAEGPMPSSEPAPGSLHARQVSSGRGAKEPAKKTSDVAALRQGRPKAP